MLVVSLSAPETLKVVEREEAEPQPDQVRVRVKAAGIGGTDLRIFKGVISAKLPLVLGQEFAGVIDKVGSASKGVSVGDRVAIEPIVRDNTCDYCKTGTYTLCDNLKVIGINVDGGYSESVCVPAYTVHRLPDNLSFEEGALVVPGAVALYAVARAGGVKGAAVAVVGAGPIGLCAMQIAKLSGAAKVVAFEPLEVRRTLAATFGASDVAGPSQDEVAAAAKGSNGGKGFDVVIEATGNPEIVDTVVALARRGGRVVFAGAFGKASQVGMGAVVRKDLDLRGSWLYPGRYAETLELARGGGLKLGAMVSQRFSLPEAAKAFEAAQKPGIVKVVLTG